MLFVCRVAHFLRPNRYSSNWSERCSSLLSQQKCARFSCGRSKMREIKLSRRGGEARRSIFGGRGRGKIELIIQP